MTSQFAICPVPFHIDTYKGCAHNCCYCFGRDLTVFHRRRRGLAFSHIEANDPEAFTKYLISSLGRNLDPDRADIHFLKKRMPLKIGAISDPCPPVEPFEGVTERFLRILGEIDYPVQIQTKNPDILHGVLQRIGSGLNLTISVSLISLDDQWLARVEPGAPTATQRLAAISRIVYELGYPVMVKIQPAVYPKILSELGPLVAAIANVGCWAFNTEGLKVRISMPPAEQKIFRKIGSNVRETYRHHGTREGGDWTLSTEHKNEYISLASQLASDHGLKYYSADNEPLGVGYGFECCGTEKLRNYRLLLYNLRTAAFGVRIRDDMGNGLVNFTRSKRFAGTTINKAMDHLFQYQPK